MEKELKSIIVAVGSYEGGLLVYAIDLIQGFHVPMFSARDNLGALKTLHISNKFLFTGGKDELLRAYNIKKKSSEGGIPGQKGTIGKIMTSEGYLLASGSDGNILIHGIKDFTSYESLNCHPADIIDFDVHSSGRMLVTIGMDKKIKLWNLMNMKEAYHKNIWKTLDYVQFLPDDNLLLGYGSESVVFKIDDNSISASLEHEARLTSMKVLGDLIITSDDEGWMYFRKYENRSDMSCVKFRAYDGKRVKTFEFHKEAGVLVTISTEGFITVWPTQLILAQLETLDNKLMNLDQNLEYIYHFKIDSRLICLASKIIFSENKAQIAPKTSKKVSKQTQEKKRINKKVKMSNPLLSQNKLKKLKFFNSCLKK